jgi:glycosyltransferase involved in cell wall biosynthesis
MNNDSKLHLLMPTYNRAKILSEILPMVMEQDVPQSLWHITVVDNHSTDDTVNLLKEYAESYSNFHYKVNEKNIGLFGNINRCMDLAESEKYMIIHSDDQVSKFLVSRALKAIKDYPDTSIIFGAASIKFLETGELLQKWHPSKSLTDWDRRMTASQFMTELIASGSNFIFAPTVIYNRKLLMNGPRFSEHYRYTSDFLFWLDIAKMGADVAYYSDSLITCIAHKDRLSNENSKLMRLEYLDICRKNLALLKSNPYMHELSQKKLFLIKIKLIIYEVIIRLNINPSFKTRRFISKFFDANNSLN